MMQSRTREEADQVAPLPHGRGSMGKFMTGHHSRTFDIVRAPELADRIPGRSFTSATRTVAAF